MELEEQNRVLQNTKKNMLISASAGSGKTYIMIKYICQLICDKKSRVPVKDFLVLTFTKSAANQMKQRLLAKLKEQPQDEYIIEQIDALSTANISTIHSFCEKYLKKYANLLNLNENFSLLDENMAQEIKERAFASSLKNFNGCEEYEIVLECFKHNTEKIKGIIFEIEKLVVALANKEKFLEENLKNPQMFFDSAVVFLFEYYKNYLQSFLKTVDSLHLEDFYDLLKESVAKMLESKDIFEFYSFAEQFKFPNLPRKSEIGEELVLKLRGLRTKFNARISKLKDLKLGDKENLDFQREGLLEKAILKLYQIYDKEQEEIKSTLNCLDFNDLEKNMSLLSQHENLFKDFKYVFIDEYQDTNKIQEKIIKNVAKNCNFVAVGDAKQGIYGFRLASAEIFLKDLKDFQEGEDSAVNFLQSNFRSAQEVLDFVNDVFKVCMTEEITKIDYENTSMLQGRSEFVNDGQKAVNIELVVAPQKKEIIIPTIYDVRAAEIIKDERNFPLLCDILLKIKDALSSQISDNGQPRQVKFGDIAILSRKRDGLFNDIEKFLTNFDIPVLSNSRQNLSDEPQIKVLINFLKLALSLDDEIALLSVLTSGLYSLSFEDILKQKGDKNLREIVESNQNKLFSDFNDDLKTFRFEYQVFGIRKSLERIFSKRDFRAFINLKPNGIKLNIFIDNFLKECEKFDYDLPALINYFENVEISVSAEASASEENVLLTTIHDSKGLEYPIVFLINCDVSLSKAAPKVDVEIDEKFGFAVKLYDKANNSELQSVRMRAIKDSRRQREFVEELMIFYVALTRAKNRLYLFGFYDESFFEKLDLRDCDSYFDFIFFALKDVKPELDKSNMYEKKNLRISVVDGKIPNEIFEKQNLENMEILPEIAEKIEKYLNFSYKLDSSSNFKLKESVTALTSMNQENTFEKFANDNFNFSDNYIETGNAYHLALKSLDFQKISDLQSLKQELELLGDVVDRSLLDEEILLKNVLILKDLTNGAKIFKEKEFVLKEKLCELLKTDVDDKILVQGIVDLFAIKDNEIILVDYKYTNHHDKYYLINKYNTQLKLYKIALENAFNMKVSKAFLLSLKFAELIEMNF